jgi:diguanylate cyclase (GGDEF)-like protein
MVVVPTPSAKARANRDDLPQVSQLSLIYSLLPASQAVALGTGAMLVIGLSSVIKTEAAVGWFTALLLVSLGRTYLGVLFRRASSPANGVSVWRTYFTIGAVASGLVWGSTALLLYAPESILHQVFLAFVLGGMVIGAVAALTPLFLAFVLFATCVLLPMIVRYLATGDYIHNIMATMGALFLLAMVVIGKQIHGTITESLNLRFDRATTERRLMMEHAVTRVLADAENLDEVVPTIIETICRNMGWHYGALYRHHPDEGIFRCEDTWGIDADPIREFIASVSRRTVAVADGGQGIVRRTFALGKPVWISDIAKDDTLRRKALVIKAGLHGAFAFPLSAGKQVLGILEFFHADVLEPDAMLLETADSIGSQIGQYIVRRKAEAEKHLAMHDALTGLPSRLLFMERLEHAVVQAHRHGRRLAVMFIDLDRFKSVNDTLGHEAGDKLLREMARRLKIRLREGDTVARIGGDEFVMLLEEIATTEDALLIGETLIPELGRPYPVSGQEVTVTASVGVSTYPADGLDANTLVRHADAAMYAAKAKGRNACESYSHRLRPVNHGLFTA